MNHLPKEGLIFHKILNDQQDFITRTFPEKENQLNERIQKLENENQLLKFCVFIIAPFLIFSAGFLFYILFNQAFSDLFN